MTIHSGSRVTLRLPIADQPHLDRRAVSYQVTLSDTFPIRDLALNPLEAGIPFEGDQGAMSTCVVGGRQQCWWARQRLKAIEIIVEETATVKQSYFADEPRMISIHKAYDADMIVFDRTVAERYNALVDAGFEINCIVEHQRYAVEHNDPKETDLPNGFWKLPQSLRFWAVAR